jgi:hypothetical protein
MGDEMKTPEDLKREALARKRNRAEFDELHRRWADSMTPASDDPKDPRKKGPALTPEESKRLHELHSLI